MQKELLILQLIAIEYINRRETVIFFCIVTVLSYFILSSFCFNPFTAEPVKALHFAILV